MVTEKNKRRTLFSNNVNYDEDKKAQTKIENKFGHGIAQVIIVRFLELNEHA